LLIICLLALLYTYPVHSFEANPVIEIPAISLKIPLRDAVGVFPTIVAAVYLVFVASAISESMLRLQRSRYANELGHFRRTGKIPNKESTSNPLRFSPRFFFLPSPLHRRGFVYGAAALPKAVVDGFVGLVFTLLPYATETFVLMRSWELLKSRWMLIWNCMCLTTMLLAFIGAILGSRPFGRWTALTKGPN
jgi:hypothetical protein